MAVDLPRSGVYLYRDHYNGTLRVLCHRRYRAKPFTFQLIRAY